MKLSKQAALLPGLNAAGLIPLAVVAFIVWLMHRRGLQIWQAIVCIVLGVIVAGTAFGPTISSFLPQISGGYLH
jgi:mannose/fructose/N-acetylgalactosamine-specific phosphotransferase system component IID